MGWGGRWKGDSGCGTHVNPWLIHVSVWQKPLQYCKVISLQLIKAKGKKNEIVQLEKKKDQPTKNNHTSYHMTMRSRLLCCCDLILHSPKKTVVSREYSV